MRGRWLRWVALVFAAGVFAEVVSASDSGDVCRVTVEVTPRTAVVGQQVLYRVRIVRREDVANVKWVVQPGFPGLRAEWLPGRPEDTDMRYKGVRYFAREEQRALFPARAGEAATSPASIRCTLERAGPRPAESHVVEVPSVSLRVTAPPARGQPADFSGVIGPVRLTTTVNPLEISLGRSIAVAVSASGHNNVWDSEPPLGGRNTLDGAEVFTSPPDVELSEGERLHVQQYFRYEIVPRREGGFEFPEVRVPYYDPDTGRYDVARAPAVRVSVLPRAALSPQRSRPPEQKRVPGRSESRPEPASVDLGWIVAGVVTLAVGAFATFRWSRRRNDPWAEVDSAMGEADAAAGGGDPIAEANALRRGLALAVRLALPHIADAEPAALRAAGSSDRLVVEVAALLEALDWIRFSGELGHPDRCSTRDAIVALRARTAASKSA